MTVHRHTMHSQYYAVTSRPERLRSFSLYFYYEAARLHHGSRSSACKRISAPQLTMKLLSARAADIRAVVGRSGPAALQQAPQQH